MTEEELREKMYQIKLEIANLEYDHHNQFINREERIETLKKEYAKVKKELMRIRLEERRNR